MPVTPTSSVAVELSLLRDMVAASAAFQARLGVGDAAAAKAKIFVQTFKLFPGEDQADKHAAQRPYAVIIRPQGELWSAVAGGPSLQMRRRGEMVLYLTDNAREADPLDDALDFDNFWGGVVDDLATASGSGGNLAIEQITIVEPAAAPNERYAQSAGRFRDVLLSVSWN